MPIDRIVVAGGGVAGWMAASMLARALEGGTTAIHVVEQDGPDDSLGVATHAEMLLPRTVERSAKAGFDEDALIRATRGTFALGTAVSGWRDGPPGFLPFGDIGAPMGPVAFHQLAARLRSEGEAVNLANYTLAALCAQTGRFARPRPEDRSVLSTLDYGIHVETSGYRDFLRADAIAHGVTVTHGRVLHAERDEDGTIATLLTDTNMRIKGDLFVDTLAASTLPRSAFEIWSDWLPGNATVAYIHESDEAALPFSHLEADTGSLRRLTPLQGALAELAVVGDTKTATGHPLAPGRRATPWQHNCVAIGGAAVVIDPIAGFQVDLCQSAIVRLIGLLPNERASRAEAAEYNRQTIEELEGARDAAIMFYKGNARIGDPYWNAARTSVVPERLAHKIALFESCGRIALHDGETLDEAGWVGLFEALGIRARRYDALADGIDRAAIDTHFARIRDVMLKAVASVPPHSDYLRELGR